MISAMTEILFPVLGSARLREQDDTSGRHEPSNPLWIEDPLV
jgi:hypothetical protein